MLKYLFKPSLNFLFEQFDKILIFRSHREGQTATKRHLLGSLLLLLLLLLGTLVLFRFGGGLDNRFRFGLLLLLLLGDKEAEHLLGLDHVVLIDVELAEHIVDLGLGHLVAPGLEG